jgi:hypothetical protein
MGGDATRTRVSETGSCDDECKDAAECREDEGRRGSTYSGLGSVPTIWGNCGRIVTRSTRTVLRTVARKWESCTWRVPAPLTLAPRLLMLFS